MPTTIAVLDGNSSLKTVTTLELYGTAAGTPSTSPLTIQPSTVPMPISSGTPVYLSSQSGAITVASITSGTVVLNSTSPVNIAQVGGNTVATASGATSSGTLRVTL